MQKEFSKFLKIFLPVWERLLWLHDFYRFRRIYQYVVRRKGYEHRYNAMQLRTIQDWIVRRQLLGTEGVADVASFGGDLKAI